MRDLFSAIRQFALFNPCFLLAAFACLLVALFIPTDRPRLELPDGPLEVTGWVASPVQSFGDAHYFELRPLQLRAGDHDMGPYPGRVAVYLPSRREALESAGAIAIDPATELLFGDIVRIRTHLEDPRFYAVPGVPDYRETAWNRGILHVAHLKSSLQISRAGVYLPAWALRPVFRYGMMFECFCRRAFTQEQLVLVLSLFLGRDKALNELDTNSLKRLGILHIFVVSGSHVSLLLACLHFALARFGTAGRFSTLAGVWCYVLLVGLNPPVARSALMATIFYALFSFGLSTSFMNILGLSALALVAVSPRVLATSGFQLSYLSLAAIGFFVMPLQASLHAISGGIRDVFSDKVIIRRDPPSVLRRRTRYAIEQLINFYPRPPALVRHTAAKSALYLLEISTCSWFVQLVILPVTLWYSNMWIWTQWFSNLLLIPLFGLLVPLYLLLFLVFWTPAGGILASAVGLYGSWLLALLASLDRLCRITYLPHPRQWEIWGFLVAFLVLYLTLRRPWRLVAHLVPVCLFLALRTGEGPKPHPGTLNVTMLDVGQGDCLHLSYPSGLAALIDTGGSSEAGGRGDFVGEKVVARYLWEDRIPELGYVLISHAHRDHAGGLDFLRGVFPIGRIYRGPHQATSSPGTTPGFSLAAGDRFEIDGVRARVLHPARSNLPQSDENDESLVLLITYGDFSILLTGDAGKSIEQSLLEEVPRTDILKAAHHGGRNSNSVEFLRKTAPTLVLISAGRWNPFGHPSPFTLARLEELGIRWLSTPDSGTIRIETDGRTWKASVWDPGSTSFRLVDSGRAAGGQDRLRSPNSPKPLLSSTFLSK